jgi:hypothetical protein
MNNPDYKHSAPSVLNASAASSVNASAASGTNNIHQNKNVYELLNQKKIKVNQALHVYINASVMRSYLFQLIDLMEIKQFMRLKY